VLFGFLKTPSLSPRQHRLQNTPLFRTLKPLEIKFVDGLMHERRYLPDEIIFDAGDEGQALYLVMGGCVRVTRDVPGKPLLVSDMEPGNFFGDLALLDNSPRSGQARALEGCELAVFFRDDFLALMETDAVIGYKISLALARHMGQLLRYQLDGDVQLEAL
jgi:CRP/FNR family cyclic AMP-dependent transcriptional regulator